MSAHRQSKAHIDALVTTAITMKVEGIHQTSTSRKFLTYAHNGRIKVCVPDDNTDTFSWCDRLTATSIGAMLWNENTKSLAYRYDAAYADDGEYGTYEPTRHLTLPEICTAIDGYMYQACEHPEWLSSEAYAFCVELKAALLSAATKSARDDVETWSIREEDVRKAKDFDEALHYRDFLGDDGIHIRIV